MLQLNEPRNLEKRTIGCRCFDSVGDPNGTVYIADRLTDGRGTKRRRWVGENTGNLYMSFVLHIDLKEGIDPYTDRSREFDCDISGALATLKVLEDLGLDGTKVKWLNDLWIKGHKLLGSLTEYKGRIAVKSKEHHLFVLGIGLNINCDMRRDPDMSALATSVKCELGHRLAREDIFYKICNQLEPLLEMERDDLMKIYEANAAIKPGDKVIVHMKNDTKLCIFEGLSNNWSANLKDESGKMFSSPCTEISIKPYREKMVYVLNDPNGETWSHKLLLKTCGALVDSQRYEVKSFSAENVTSENLSSCALIVIGHLKTTPQSAGYVTAVMDFIRKGGSCLCVGNACRLLQSYETFSVKASEHKDQNPTVVTTTAKNESKSKINLCLFHELKIDYADLCKSTRVIAYGNLESDGQRKGYLTNSFADSVSEENRSDIMVCELGKGKICFCAPNIEITYADIYEHFPALCDKRSFLQETIFERDSLFIEILRELECE